VIEHFLREIIIDRRSSISILYGFYVKVFHLLVALVPSGEKCLSKRKMAGVADAIDIAPSPVTVRSFSCYCGRSITPEVVG
jgi:hypothetical protein